MAKELMDEQGRLARFAILQTNVLRYFKGLSGHLIQRHAERF